MSKDIEQGKFNTSIYGASYNYKGARISFSASNFPSQCGAKIIHNFHISRRGLDIYELGEQFAKDLKHYIKTGSLHSSLPWPLPGAGAKVVASAPVNTNLYRLLDNDNWQVGTAKRNSNSGRSIAIFELDIRG